MGSRNGQPQGPGESHHWYSSRRMEATSRTRLRRASPAANPVSRRAHLRCRSHLSPTVLGSHSSHGRGRCHRLCHHALYGRSRILQSSRAHLPWQDGRSGHALRVEAQLHERRVAARRVRAAGQRGGGSSVGSGCDRRRGLWQRSPSGRAGCSNRGAAHRPISQRQRRHSHRHRKDSPHARRRLRFSHHNTRRRGGSQTMSPTRLLAVARKEILHILRDARSLGIVVIMPVTLMLLFGYGVNLDLKRLPVYVYDRDGSQQSQDLLRRFHSNQYFQIVSVVNDYPAVTRAIDDGSAKLGIVIPWDFSQRLSRGGPVQVQALVDGTDDNTANVAIGYAQAVVQGYSSQVQLDWLQARGQTIQPAPMSVQTRTWYNEDLASSSFIIPGVLALVMSVIGAFLTSLTIAREWERGSMEQLISTPVTAMEIMLGKLAPYFVLGMFDVAVCAVIAISWV